ncbi:hypothetical protein CCR85_02640 [Rhodothalassium salexigens]|uniref:type II secretion system protein GspK n=1 Tax=Rhodothalassium salexigens TaxID=1086 RepID=UPI001913596C|nr:type II secretion system protein GspK [Rhodothalassium salexigens]MBK5910388.1 hypothetical protein [Rhodothalassium salexigens]
MFNKAHRSTGRRAAGFALPLVLVFVLVYATITLIGVEAAQRGQSLARSLSDRVEAEKRLASTEARALYQLLTAQPAAGGVDTDAPAPTGVSFDRALATAANAGSYWAGNGGLRRDANGVLVAYQDAAGLVSVNTGSAAEIVALLGLFDIRGDEARRLAARLLDYRDEDNRRRFLGAERPAYRLVRRPVPTNSPFRTVEEVARVLGWDEHAALWAGGALSGFTTTAQRSIPISTAFMPERLAEAFDDDVIGAALRELGSPVNTVSKAPSNTAHLTFYSDYLSPVGPRTLARTILVERTPNAADRPFKRRLLSEDTTDKAAGNDADRTFPPLLSPERERAPR